MLKGKTDVIEFTVPAVPVAQPRQRHSAQVICGRVISRNYTPAGHAVNSFRASVRMAAREAYSGPPLDGPLCVDVVAVFPRPQSQIWKRREMPRQRHAKKPDRDNLDKAILDCLSGILWRDDCQVCAGSIEKWIAAGDEQPHVTVRVSSVSSNAQAEQTA